MNRRALLKTTVLASAGLSLDGISAMGAGTAAGTGTTTGTGTAAGTGMELVAPTANATPNTASGASASASANVTVCDGENVTVFPDNSDAALVNPSMGWTHYCYGNRLWAYGAHLLPSETLDWFPGLSSIYFKLYWSDLEPEEGQFRWDVIDSYAQPWVAAGRQLCFRIATCDHRHPYGTPKWVYDAGAKGFRFGKDGMEPLEYSDPVYLEKLENFVAAMGRRYDGRPEVAFVEVGSFGLWGEGHTVMTSHLSQEKTDEIFKKHVAIYRKHFPHTLLCVSDDVAGNANPGPEFPIMDFARSQGVTMRDDSIMVSRNPPWFHANMAQRFWPTMPVVMEHEHWGLSRSRGAWDPELLANAMEAYHASFMSAHWFPDLYLEANRDLIHRINQRLGYRLNLRKAEFPKRIPVGSPLTISSVWANVGVAPCYPGGFVAFTLKDEKGRTAWVCSDESFDLRELQVAEPGKAQEVRHDSRCHFGNRVKFPKSGDAVYSALRSLKEMPDWLGDWVPTLKPGKYSLYVSVGTRDGSPVIALPLSDGDGQRRYRIGEIEITEGPDS